MSVIEQQLPEAMRDVLGAMVAETDARAREVVAGFAADHALHKAQCEAVSSETRAGFREAKMELREVVDAQMRDVRSVVDGMLKRVEEAVAGIRNGRDGEPGPRGEKGETGEPGPRGEQGVPGEPGERGELGKTGDSGPQGEPGPRGEQGEQGERGEPGLAGERGERGEVGAQGDQGPQGEIGEPGARGEQGEHGPVGDPGPRGELGPAGERGERGLKGDVGQDGLPGRDGRDGFPGVQGERGKDGRDGVDGFGFDDLSVVQGTDPRDVTLRFQLGERIKDFDLRIPALQYRGVYKVGEVYRAGDCATFGGSMWIAWADETSDKPGTSEQWRLAVKHGRDGRDRAKGDD